MSAVLLLAKSELRRRWPALLVLAVLAALGGALVTSSTALARRTTTAFDRLTEATGPAEAQIFVNASPADPAIEAVKSLDGVEASWTVDVGVAALGDDKVYLGMIGAAEDPPPGLFRPLVVTGRLPDPSTPDELMVSEDLAGQLLDAGIDVGDRLPLTFLTAEDYRSFDTGFGRPGGPTVDAQLVGTYQMAGGSEGVPPVVTSRAFVAAHPDALVATQVVLVRLSDGADGVPELRRQVDALSDEFEVAAGAEEFDTFQIEVPGEARSEIQTTARVLGAGLAAFAGVAALVALFLLAQGFNRYHGAANEAEAAHAALGVTSGQILGARLAAAAPVALLAGALVAVVGVATAGLEPLGSMRALEPHPGPALNVGVVAAGALLTMVVVLVLVAVTLALTTRRARARRRAGATPGERSWRWPAGSPSTIGVRFTVGRDRAAAPLRSAMAGVAVAVVGVAAGTVFGASLDRLVAAPARFGWSGEFAIVDADEAAAARVAADPAVAGATRYTQTTVRIGDDRRYVNAYEDLVGDTPWWISRGLLPTAPDQVVLEPNLAEQQGVGIGDEITAGPAVRLRVVGIGVGPDLGNGAFGEQALVTPAGAERLGGTAPFTEIVVDVAPGHSVQEVMGDYGRDYELTEATPPAEIDNLSQLGRLPELLTAFLAVIGLAALTNALWVSLRRRRRDLAVLRVLGHTPREAGAVVMTMALVAAGIGAVLGLPIGIAVGRTLWRVVAESSAVEGDALVAAQVLVGLPFVVVAVAVAVAVPAAWLAGHRRPAGTLRSE